jgi:hypothetical protein
VVFARNPYYFRTGKPYINRIVANTNVVVEDTLPLAVRRERAHQRGRR